MTGEIVPRSDQLIESSPLSPQAAHGRQERLGRGAQEVEGKAREEPEHHDHDASGTSVTASVRLMSVRWPPSPRRKSDSVAERHPLEHPQQIRGREHHDDDRGDRDDRRDAERADEDEELADEAGQPGQARPKPG